MRATEFITELFQPGKDVNFKWSRPFKDEVNVLGKTPQGHELSVNFWEISDDIVAIDFTIDANSDQDPDPDTPTKSGHELTKHGEEFAVFTQVVNAITQYLNKLPKNNVFFQVKRTEAQREPLYLKIANRVAKQLGFRHGTAQELEATNPGLYNKFDNRYSKLLWYTKDQQNVAESFSNEKVKLWIEKVYDMFPQTWQNNHVMPLGGEGDDQQFAMFELVPSNSKRDAVEVKWFQAYPLRKGVGSRAMTELQKLAQEDGISLTLYPWDKGQISQSKLMKFYKGQGFKPTVKGSKNMYWSPTELTVAENESIDTPTIGINVRTDGDIDYAGLIVDGKKKYESRKTDSLGPYVGKTVGIVRTGKGPAVAIGQVTIGEPIVVDAEKFNSLRKQHLVPQGSKFDIDVDGTKYLYPIINPIRWDNEKLIKHKGIVSRKLQELYEPESSFKLHWYHSDDPREQVARAYDRNKGFIDIKFTPVMPLEFNDMVEVEFSRNDSYDMTGGGDASRVLGTVLQAFREYLHGYQPKILFFAADGDSRSKVYQNLIKRFALGAGYKQFDTNKLSKKMQEKLSWTRGAGGGIMILTKMQ